MDLTPADKALAAGIAAATAPRGKHLILDRGPAQPVIGNAFDLAIAGIEAGAQRVEVTRAVEHRQQVRERRA
jgi:hypothetical protein